MNTASPPPRPVRHLRLRRPSLSRDIYDYIAENGPVQMAAIRDHFPDQTGRTLSAILNVLHKRRDVTRVGKPGVFTYTASPRPAVEALDRPKVWLRQDKSNLATHIFHFIQEHGSSTVNAIRTGILNQGVNYHAASFHTGISRMARNGVIVRDPTQTRRPYRYMIGTELPPVWEDREPASPTTIGARRSSYLDILNHHRNDIIQMLRRGSSPLAISRKYTLHIRMVYRWIKKEGWWYDRTSGRYWAAKETPYSQTLQDISRDIGGLKLKALRDDALSGEYTLQDLTLKYDQSAPRIRLLLKWWNRKLSPSYEATDIYESIRALPFRDGIRQISLPNRIRHRLLDRNDHLPCDWTVDDIRQELGRENGGRIGAIKGVGPSAIRILRQLLHVQEPYILLTNEDINGAQGDT